MTRIRFGWENFRELLHALIFNKLKMPRHVRGVVFYGSDTWAVKEGGLIGLEKNDMMTAPWICNVILKNRKSSDELIDRIGNCIQIGRLRWVGYVERMDKDRWVKKCRDIVVEGRRRRGRPRKS